MKLSPSSCLVVLALAGPALAGPSLGGEEVVPGARGPSPETRLELQANRFTTSTQERAALDLDALGRGVVAWQSKRQDQGGYGVFARAFDTLGRSAGDDVQLNLFGEGHQVNPAVALEDDGTAWVAWESHGQDGHHGGVVLRRFEPGLVRGSNERFVHDDTVGHQAEVSLDADSLGAVVAWTGPIETGGRAVFVRRFGADLEPVGGALVAGQAEGASDNLPVVRCDGEGGFVVTWARTDLEGRPIGVWLRRFDAGGLPLGDEVAVREGLHIEPTLALTASGDAIVGWLSGANGDYAPNLCRVELTGDEAAAGEPFTWTPAGPGYTSGLDVAVGPNDRVLATWSTFSDPIKKAGLFARTFDAQLAPEGGVERVTESVEGHQRLGAATGSRRVAWLPDGRRAFAWDGSGAGDGSGAYVTLVVPGEVDADALAAERPAPEAEAETPEGARPHEPPFFDPPPVIDESLLGPQFTVSGPDYGFPAITQTSLTPPDPDIAAGPDHVVAIVNGRMSFYDQDGTQTFTVPTDGGGGFWASVGANGFIFDPEVLYDPHTGRFMAMLNERAGAQAFFLLAVSDDSDPNGTWFKYRFDVTAAAGDTDIDSPNMAVDDTAVYLTADFFGPDKYLIFIVEKAPLLVGGVPITRDLLITGDQSIGIPITYDANAPAQYMIESFESFSNTQVRFHAITDPLGSPQRTTFTLNVPTYDFPEDPPQMGTSVRPITFEPRFWSCVYRNGSLWATHHVNASRVRQRWYEFDMSAWPAIGTPSLVQWGEIDPGGTIRTFFGSISVDDAGNAGMCFARSSPTEFISMARTFREPGDAPGTTKPMVISQPSTGPETANRWGDYSGISADPDADGAFWVYHEYHTSFWRTWVGLMGPCDPPVVYCTAKVTSLGTTPAISHTGEPSVGVNAFSVDMTGGPPNRNGILFYGSAANSAPFLGGTLCAQQPIVRLTPIFTLDGAGATSRPIPIDVSMLGETRFFQFWFRDPPHPDGTTVGLSDGLEVTFCP